MYKETSYKNEFVIKESSICPAKKEINSNSKFSHLKNMLKEQGDNRGMNPEFKAIATSKHYFV